MSTLPITILAFLFVLGVLVFVHEFGHFLVARLYGVRVITFSLGFGPKLLKVRRGQTEYCISVVPLGGYVKLAGETVEDARTHEPDEFLSKSKWIRLQVYLAGPVMNMLLAVVLLTVVLMRGADVPLFETAAPVVGSVVADSTAAKAGFLPGDRIVRVNGRDVPTWNALDAEVAPKADREVAIDIIRDSHPQTIKVTPEGVTQFKVGTLGVMPVLRPQIQAVNKGYPADLAGFQTGDVILAVGGARNLSKEDIVKRIQASIGAPLAFTLERDGQVRDVSVKPDQTGHIGVSLYGAEMRRIDPNLLQAVRMSAQQNWDNAVTIGRTLKGLVTAETPVKQLMGPVAIAQLSGETIQLGLVPLLALMAMISLNLGLLNLMPIPVFDGGQIALLALESIYQRFFNRDLSIKVKEGILLGGAALIVLLMVTVLYNDVMRIIVK